MGDRANVCVKGEDGAVFFYTHWRGYELDKVVAAGLGHMTRWNDVTYLRRILFCEMLKGAADPTTGFGISPMLGDNEYPVIVVDTKKRTVGLAKEASPKKTYVTVGFEEFIAHPEALGYHKFDSDGNPITGD